MKRILKRKMVRIICAAVLTAIWLCQPACAAEPDSGGQADAAGWRQVENRWYYYDESGRMQTGWVQVRDKWYYLYSDGSMAANTQISGRTLGADGAEIR